jgi:methyl-accepting chemotaxis protein
VESISKSTEEFIQEISKSNDQYGEILNLIKDIAAKTQVINDIVFQTKLLSFNASVEAARAGDNGKGFAVVAEEVGNLASMSGKAATEISQLLENSLSQVDHIIQTTKSTSNLLAKKSHDKVTSGVLRARECIDSLNQIQLTISKLNEMIEEISVASKEQSVGVQEINRALNEMDQVTQSNSQVANEGGEYAKLLQIQSERLKNLVQDLSSALGRKG